MLPPSQPYHSTAPKSLITFFDDPLNPLNSDSHFASDSSGLSESSDSSTFSSAEVVPLNYSLFTRHVDFTLKINGKDYWNRKENTIVDKNICITLAENLVAKFYECTSKKLECPQEYIFNQGNVELIAFIIAVKYLDEQSYSINNFIYDPTLEHLVTHNGVTIENISKQEATFLRVIDFQIKPLTQYEYTSEYLLKNIKKTKVEFLRCKRILVRSIHKSTLNDFRKWVSDHFHYKFEYATRFKKKSIGELEKKVKKAKRSYEMNPQISKHFTRLKFSERNRGGIVDKMNFASTLQPNLFLLMSKYHYRVEVLEYFRTQESFLKEENYGMKQ
jgi:hypothetical protein